MIQLNLGEVQSMEDLMILHIPHTLVVMMMNTVMESGKTRTTPM
jgi:hypothetical protein